MSSINPAAAALSIARRRRAGLALLATAAGAGALLVLSRADLALFAVQPTVLQAHILAAAGAFGLGGALMMARKGRAFHRAAGWLWVALMATVAGSSLFIVGLNGDAWSWIHLLSGWTLIALPLGVIAARGRRLTAHRRTMMSLYYGGMVIAGAFTFVPGRLMWRLFFG